MKTLNCKLYTKTVQFTKPVHAMYQIEEADSIETKFWANCHSPPSSISQELSTPSPTCPNDETLNTITWIKPPTSLYENGSEFFHFTDQPNGPPWNGSSSELLEDTEIQENEEVIDDTFTGKNYEVFETKLKDGFLEATGLGLVFAPPAMFDYRPPLQRVDLKENKIELLPEYFFDELPMLRWCDLRYNRLQSLPPMNKEHSMLNILLAQDNKLADLPCSLAYAINLQTLGWTNNSLVDPPRHILLQGCQGILKYLRQMLTLRLPIDKHGNPKELPNDAKLQKDLETIKLKAQVNRSSSRCSVTSGLSTRSSVNLEKEKLKQQKRIDRIKYTWGLWKDVPYHGISSQSLFDNSIQEMKDDMNAQLNQKKTAILQKMKDKEAVEKWRKEARVLQMQGSLKPYTGVFEPFGTDKDIQSEKQSDGRGDEAVNPETFRSTLQECMRKLQSFAQSPAPLNDTEKSLQRLREVEDIQRKISDMRLTWSVKSSAPI